MNSLSPLLGSEPTLDQFLAEGRKLSDEAGVLDTLHGYFTMHAERLHRCCAEFGLFRGSLGNVLEVGPFFGHTPFLLAPLASDYVVLEGDDPAAYSLKALYARRGIRADFVDLFEMFGPTREAVFQLDFPAETFDTILCWETMEHFNFNPVKFVREMHRVLKPGGRVCVTVPNRESFQKLVGLATGRRDREAIDKYFEFEDYVSNGKKAFYGFHWHEYTIGEVDHLFRRAGFHIDRCDTFVAFMNQGRPSAVRLIARGLSRSAATLLKRFGTNVLISAIKPR